MKHPQIAMQHQPRRRPGPWSSRWLAYSGDVPALPLSNKSRRSRPSDLIGLPAGCLAVVTVLSLSLLLYCVPPRTWVTPHRNTSNAQTSSAEYSDDTEPGTASVVEANIKAAGGMLLQREAANEHGEQSLRAAAERIGKADSAEQCQLGRCTNGTISPQDFVFAIATHEFNEPALVAGRAGRLGVRTYISTNYTPSEQRRYPSIESEVWGYYPDDKQLRSFYEGDTRAALVPFLAYRDLGETFKWVFYGDDDTIFFVDAAMKLVKDLDPDMPYFLTDHFWYSNWNYGYPWHPHWRAPRCLPCFSELDTSTLRMDLVKACPCTPRAMCDLEGGYDGVLDARMCSAPRAPTLTYSMHGGAGALISVGLLRKVSLRQMELCALQEWNTGGDSFITTCLWQAGYGMTDPGPVWHPEGLTRFDPSPRKLIYDTTAFIIRRAAYTVGNLIAKAAGVCDGQCQLEMDHVISLHFRGRLLTNTSQGAGALLRGVTRFYNLHTGRLEAAKQAGGAYDTEDDAAQSLAAAIDSNFTQTVQRLKAIVPRLKAVSETQKSWELDNAALLFVPTKAYTRSKTGSQEVELSLEDLVKGAASGLAQTLLEAAQQRVLEVYPPPRRAPRGR